MLTRVLNTVTSVPGRQQTRGTHMEILSLESYLQTKVHEFTALDYVGNAISLVHGEFNNVVRKCKQLALTL